MAEKEAKDRIKINKILEVAGGQFFDTPERRANILLENNVKLTVNTLNGFGENFEKLATALLIFFFLMPKVTHL